MRATGDRFLGIDLGTSSVRALLLDADGGARGQGAAEYAFETPWPGWAEQDPATWWEATVRAVRAAAGEEGARVAGVGLSGQMHGMVLVNEAGEAVRPAILWPDTRAAEQVGLIQERVGEERHYAITGNPCATGFQGPSLLWIQQHEPETFQRAATCLLPKDWLRYRLTGGRATDPTDACGTALFHIGRGEWSEAILSALGLPAGLLPEVLPTLSAKSTLTAKAADELRLPAGTPVVTGGGDQAMAAFGLGLSRPGDGALAVSTGGQLLAVAERGAVAPVRGLHLLAHVNPDRRLVMGAILSAGLSLRWLRDGMFGGRLDYGRLVEMAETAPLGAEGLLFAPYLAGERTPHLDPKARGAFVGLTVRHTGAHLVRAVLEGVAFAFRDALELMAEAGARPRRLFASGGGCRSALWRQILADVLGVELAVIGREEHSVLGAALAAAVGVGAIQAEGMPDLVRTVERVYPRDSEREIYGRMYEVWRGIYPALRGEWERTPEA